MHSIITAIENKQKKPHLVDVRSGDTVRVHQKIQEGDKTRTQMFEGLVIRTKRRQSLTNSITVRRVASGIGVEKSFLLNSPTVEKVEVVKRSKVRRNYLSYMRARSGKRAKLASVDFDRDTVNFIPDPQAEVTETPEEVEQAKAETDTEEAEAPKEDAKATEAETADAEAKESK